MPQKAAAPAGAPQTLVEGYIDAIQERRVFGWAWCRSQPSAPVDIEIRFDDRLLTTIRADCLRQDLVKAGISDGRHGFDVLLEDPIPTEHRSRLTAYGRCAPDGPTTPLVNRTSKSADRAASPTGASQQAATPAIDLQPVLGALAALQKSFAGWSVEHKAAGPKDVESELRAVREELARLVSSTDVLQMRVDAACAALSQGPGAPSSRRSDRALTLLVAALGAISCASLVLGLISVLG